MNRSPLNDPNNPTQNGRLFLAIVLSAMVMFGFHYFYERPRLEAQRAAAKAQAERELETASLDKALKATDASKVAEKIILDRAEILAQTKRIRFANEKIAGSFSTKGNRIDDLELLEHAETVNSAERVKLFTPSGTEKPYYAEFGWISKNASIKLPNQDTVWSVISGDELSPDTPVVLRWDNGQGLVFERTLEMDENYLFSISERVTNTSDQAVTLHSYQLLSRKGLPEDFTQLFILHQGPVGYADEELTELSYSDTMDEERVYETDNGWLGFSDKYWFTSIVPDQNEEFETRFLSGEAKDVQEARHQADARSAAITILPKDSKSTEFKIMAGAKELEILNGYAKQGGGMKNINLMIDFGTLYLLTKPLYWTLGVFSSMAGHVAWGIILITIMIRLMLFPLTNKSFRSMAAMKKVAPKMKEIQTQYKEDAQTMQMKLMELYQKEGVNPFSGCWPMLLQIPIFFALYKVIMLDIDLRHAPFPGWVEDMSVMDPTTIFNLFGALPFQPPELFMIGAWPCLMGFTMFLQKRLNPPPADPMQAKIMGFMPVFMTVILAKFAAGLVIYWTWSNILAVTQQYIIMRRMGVDVSLLKGYIGSDDDDEDTAAGDESKNG